MIFFLLLISCSSTNQSISSSNAPDIMEMKASFEQKDSDLAIFTLEAKRIKIVEDEYVPSSENFVVEVYNENGSEVFSSSYMKNFFMVIGEVEPKNVDSTKVYQYEWNLKNNKGKKIEPGKYKTKLIIMAKPKSYISNFDIEIK